jgi:hypothetical protein
MTALLFLIGSAFIGIKIVNLSLGNLLNKIEQCLFGIVVGWMTSTVCAYGIAYGFGRLSFNSMPALTVFVVLTAIVIWLPVIRKTNKKTLKTYLKYDHIFPLLLLFAPLYYYFFSIRMFYPEADGLYSGGNSWNDMSLHLAISSAFLSGDNFPPMFSVYAGEPLRYPFMPDFQTAILRTLGLSPYSALMLTAVPLALTITGIFYCLAVRIIKSRTASVLATILFLFNGGLGFVYFLEDWRKSGKRFGEFWGEMSLNYANMWDQKIHWANIIVDCFLPQRTSLYGIPIALMTFIIFAIIWRRWHEAENNKRWDGWKEFLFAGVLVGALPLFHAHSFVAVGLVSGFLFLINPRREWLIFWIPAVSLAAVQMILQLDLNSHLTSGKFFYWQPSWKGNDDTSWILYWIRNVGVPLLLIFPAWLSAPRPWRSFYAAFFALFGFCFFIMVTPHDYDNIKLMYYWYGLSCIIVADWLMNLARRRRQYFLAVLLVFVSIASGILALQCERLIRWRSFSSEEVAAAEFVTENTAPKSIFLTAPIHNQPILCLSGRTVLMGYGGWLWTHGYQSQQREADIKKIYAGDIQSIELLRKYKVEYIYVSHSEMETFKPNMAFLNLQFPVFYQNGEITIYKVPDETVVN